MKAGRGGPIEETNSVDGERVRYVCKCVRKGSEMSQDKKETKMINRGKSTSAGVRNCDMAWKSNEQGRWKKGTHMVRQPGICLRREGGGGD